MATKTAEIDAYIEKAQPFARPILKKVRSLFHKACPQLEEKLKWGHPSFEYKGMLGGMAAFKQHAVWGLWKASLINDPNNAMASDASSTMGGGKLSSVDDLPDDEILLDLIHQAKDLNDRGVKLPIRSDRKPKPPPKVPADLGAALKKNSKAAATFAHFSPSHKREYVEWITEAKQEETRRKRLTQAMEWIAQGKPRNWKYMKK
jgi:uncharacterized protein YdeI (YjbR/CyaY-like superfamily)